MQFCRDKIFLSCPNRVFTDFFTLIDGKSEDFRPKPLQNGMKRLGVAWGMLAVDIDRQQITFFVSDLLLSRKFSPFNLARLLSLSPSQSLFVSAAMQNS
jgi:hypothetical protein